MKKTYIIPTIDIFYDVAEPTLAGTSQHDIRTRDNNALNGGGTFGDENLGINWGTNPNKTDDYYEPGSGGLTFGDLE